MEGQFRSLIDIFKTGKEQYPDKTAIIMGKIQGHMETSWIMQKKLQV